ncbi:MAG: VanZ family protein [Burkholderiales bacterium]|nr:VanZ family protein [Burkholderiales bacterium]
MTRYGALRWAWRIVGWFGVGLLIWLSLTSNPPPMGDVPNLDKVGHVAAYALLMLWFAQLRLSGEERAVSGSGLLLLGIALEFLQAWGGVREFSIADMIADLAGITLGWLAAPPRGPNLLGMTQRLLGHA